jgi:YjbE family integral membrane protein
MAELGDAAFWGALLKIIGVNVILSGDNAVVIALACRSLPPKQQRWGIILGAGAAVVLRIIFTVFIVYLMAIPFLKIAGGLLLLWIGYKVLTDEADEADVKASSYLWGAVWTVMVADAVMSLDNVIAVAAAAKGSYLLLIIGLLISIPLVVFGATLLIKLISRFPMIITIGAALIGYVAGEVIVTDPAVEHWVATHASWLEFVAPLLGAVLVIDAARLLHPKPEGKQDEREIAGAALTIFGFRLLPYFIGELLLLEAPLIVAFVAGLLGYVVADQAVTPATHGSEGWIQAAVPVVGVVVALLVAELIARMFRKRPATR